MSGEHFLAMREAMLQEISAEAYMLQHEIGKEHFDPPVIDAMRRVPRHEFVPLELRPLAYLNRPLPIGFDKTISQPFIVALMTDLLQVRPADTVLEVGTGLGYQSAILGTLAARVYSIELVEELALQARQRLARQGYANVEVRIGNGRLGWPAHAPFDRIFVGAAPELVPPALIEQLKPGGRMVTPAGLADSQQLLLLEKDATGRMTAQEILPVRFSQLEGDETSRHA